MDKNCFHSPFYVSIVYMSKLSMQYHIVEYVLFVIIIIKKAKLTNIRTNHLVFILYESNRTSQKTYNLTTK